MGVYIPNMEKPKSCYNHCLEDFIANEEIGCPLKNYEESHQYKTKIHPDCPLIEIVTCEKCRWFFETNKVYGRCIYGRSSMSYVMPTDFCSSGERRANEK